jgi:hypothetical protein
LSTIVSVEVMWWNPGLIQDVKEVRNSFVGTVDILLSLINSSIRLRQWIIKW